MNKKIRIEIAPSGQIFAKTIGMKGEECLDYVELIEQLLEARSIDSEFTEEYEHANATVQQQLKQQNELKRE